MMTRDLPAPQPPAEGAFFTGHYRNMLAEFGLSDAEIQERIETAFQQLFYGDDDTERVYYPVGDDMAYLEDINNADIRTEGMSYGMMIAVQMNKKAEFDRIWKWARTYMYHEEGPWAGYFCWHAWRDGKCVSENPASDGEVWFVTALFFAAARWGNGEGIFNYEEQANIILHTMLHTDEGDSPVATNLFDPQTKLVVFVPEKGVVSEFTDPSYQAPHYYELWARWAKEDHTFWEEAAAAARQHWHDAAHPTTGLMTNYSEFDGRPRPMRDYGGVYYADAWRIGMMVAMDYAWFARDPWQIEQSNRYQAFFHNIGMDQYTSRYQHDGTPDGVGTGDQRQPAGLIATNAVASLAASHERAWDFIDAFLKTPIPSERHRYYDGLLYMMALLQLSGNFRIYDPTR
ncbi:glycoside hydrolase [Phototrophicus methaneseepsis]|uniref:Glycoside hydrolase n=1 Tax=Phototrophicus methaneseepsis TaxID=2710758 RepID=A0A7S8IG07_9CHLR|nr:glycosyl hydrolase family 8 [Phototrophicus methaneseepsis]QPC84147.1 glycoside hydrolase [Phototrophicus methaneseepsis]